MKIRYPVRLLWGVCLWSLVISPVTGGERPSGVGEGITARERQLLSRLEPDGVFRHLTVQWHGVPGLSALRERWQGFAREEPGFALLSALIPEAEGRPEEALEELRKLPGSDARWNEGRLLALTGQEQEAVETLTPLVLTAERAEMAAAALLALSELECLRGDFTSALTRTAAAWESRPEEEFRLRILERHLSLLVEAGQEREFLEEQIRLTTAGETPAARRTAERAAAAMADWFPADVRLREIRDRWNSAENGVFRRLSTRGRSSMECGFPGPAESDLQALARNAGAPQELALAAAQHLALSGPLPATLEDFPLLREAMGSQPFGLAASLLLRNSDPTKPFPPLMRWMADSLEPGVARRTLDLMDRAWAGKAGPEDAETLALIIAEAPRVKAYRSEQLAARIEYPGSGWPQWPNYREVPDPRILWNLQGEAWTGWYRSFCRWAPVRHLESHGSPVAPEPLNTWSVWRPDWPREGMLPLMSWAWGHLAQLREATPERAAWIARRIEDPGDRFLFAACCGSKEMLLEWCQDAALLKQVPTHVLMQAMLAVRKGRNGKDAEGKELAALLAGVREMAARLEVPLSVMIRSNSIFMGVEAGGFRPGVLALPEAVPPPGAAGAGPDRNAPPGDWLTRVRLSVPHPLFGMPFCPSVEQFRVLEGSLVGMDRRPAFDASLALRALFQFRQQISRIPEFRPQLVQEMEAFPTRNPLKHQFLRFRQLLQEAGVTSGNSRPRDSRETTAKLRNVLHQLAVEEQAWPSWHLVAAALEPEPVLRDLRFELFDARNPLRVQAREDAVPAPVNPFIFRGCTPEGAASLYCEALSDETGRRMLEPVGMVSRYLSAGLNDGFHRAVQFMSRDDRWKTSECLLECGDPLAARMAVTLVSQGTLSGSRPMLERALARFPDDPELLLASSSQKAGEAGPRQILFLRAMEHLRMLDIPVPPSQVYWCGITEDTPPLDRETVASIAAFAAKNRKTALPESWLRSLRQVLSNSWELGEPAAGTLIPAAVQTRTPWEQLQGNQVSWAPMLESAWKAGHAAAVAEAAEALLSQTLGPLASAYQSSEPARPWDYSPHPEVTGPQSEGWRLLEMAGQTEPDALAERMRTLAGQRPGDEQSAFLALLAMGRVRALTEEDLAVLDSLTQSGRHRALAFASFLLPADRLPAAVLPGAWESEAQAEFKATNNGTRNLEQGLTYLERLDAAGADQAVVRSLARLLDALPVSGDLPEGFFPRVADLIERRCTATRTKQYSRILAAWLMQTGRNPDYFPNLPGMMRAVTGAPGLEDLAGEVTRQATAVLTRAAADPPPSGASYQENLAGVAFAAAGNPRWLPLLRPLMEKHGARLMEADPDGKWQDISTLLRVLDSGRLIPALALKLEPREGGAGRLQWSFSGLRPPVPHGRDSRAWREGALLRQPALAADLAGKFDAVILAEDASGGGTVVAARVVRLPSAGECVLQGLPLAGRIRVQLYQREPPHAAAEIGPLLYGTGPAAVHFPAEQSPLPR